MTGKWTRSLVQNVHIFLRAAFVAWFEVHMNKYLTSIGNFLNSTETVTGNEVLRMYPSSRNSASTSHIDAVAEPHARQPRRGTIFGYNVSLWKYTWAVYYNTGHHCLYCKIIRCWYLSTHFSRHEAIRHRLIGKHCWTRTHILILTVNFIDIKHSLQVNVAP